MKFDEVVTFVATKMAKNCDETKMNSSKVVTMIVVTFFDHERPKRPSKYWVTVPRIWPKISGKNDIFFV